MALLIGLLLPALGSAREASRATQCAANLRQMGVGWEAAMVDANMIIPRTVYHYLPGDPWYILLGETMYQQLQQDAREAWLECATRASEGDISYGTALMFSYAVNSRWRPNGPWAANEGQRWDEIQSPTQYVWFAEPVVLPSGNVPITQAYFGISETNDWGLGFPHDEQLNIGYADGHVSRLAVSDFSGETDDHGVPLWLFDH